jgi:nucleoside-diphosphate-sugar epimerase
MGVCVAGFALIDFITMHRRTSVKRIVVTSSCAAVLGNHPGPKVYSELDWNTQSLEDVEQNGRNALPGSKYRASKTLAEKGAQCDTD